VEAKVVKNKVAPPFRIAEFDIMNTGGISRAGGILDVAVEFDVIAKSGSFYKHNEQMIGQGREAAKNYLNEHPETMDEIEKQIWIKVKQGQQVPVEVGESSEE